MIRKLLLGTVAGLTLLGVNLNGVSVSSGVLTISMEWMEN